MPRACAVCQLGGLIYFTLLGIIALVLINFLPLINFIFQMLFDGCVACVDATTAKRKPGKLKKPASLSKAPSKRVQGTASAASDAANVSNMHLTAQQLRSLTRARRLQRDELAGVSAAVGTGASFGQRLRSMGAQLIHLGAPQSSSSQEGRSLLSSQHDGVSPPPSPPRGRRASMRQEEEEEEEGQDTWA